MSEESKQNDKPEILPAEVRANLLNDQESVFLNVALFEQAQRVAKIFAESTMVPEHFRNNIGNCMIALNYAMRIKADPFMVMQTMYVVHGRPGIEGKLVEAVINTSGKYSEPLKYFWLDPKDKRVERSEVLEHKNFEDYGCQAYTVDAKSKEMVEGPKISWKLVKAEGWYDKPGSKWKTMPEMMFVYRAASWFGNKNCPELKLGMATVEELQDTVDMVTVNGKSFSTAESTEELTDRIKAEARAKEEFRPLKEVAEENTKKGVGEKEEAGSPEEKEEAPKQEPKGEPKTADDPTEDSLWAEAKAIRRTGYSTFVFKNKDRIATANPETKEKFKNKWLNLYAEEIKKGEAPYPLDDKESPATEPVATEEGTPEPDPKVQEAIDWINKANLEQLNAFAEMNDLTQESKEVFEAYQARVTLLEATTGKEKENPNTTKTNTVWCDRKNSRVLIQYCESGICDEQVKAACNNYKEFLRGGN